MRAGLTRRISGKYSLTSSAIDSILMSTNAELPDQESQKIIAMLIDNHQIKDVFVTNNSDKIDSPLTIAAQKN